MARPRKQTYTLEMYLKKNMKNEIDNNADVQRGFAWKNEQINELVVTVLTDDYIPPIILGEEDNSKLHIVDGGCRTAALIKFRYMNYKITSAIENSLITYKKKVVGDNVSITYEDAVFDIKKKTFEKFPEELREKFDEYQIETIIHGSCDSSKISKYIKRYNNHVAMNTDQKAFTYIDKFASRIREILDSRFFVECNSYSEKDKTKGVVERIVVETMMCMNHFDNWKTQAKTAFKYLNDHATEEEFNIFENNLHRLENIITEDIKDIFDKKDSFIFLTLFDKFVKLGIDDKKFAEFLREFSENLRSSKRSGKGLLFDEIDKEASTKDKQVITDKLALLEELMLEFLHISKEFEDFTVTSKDIIKEYIDKNVTDKAMELYEIEANDVSEVIENINSEFLSEANRPSFVAITAYAYINNLRKQVRNWLPDFEKNGKLFSDQKKNYLYMKKMFDSFLEKESRKSA